MYGQQASFMSQLHRPRNEKGGVGGGVVLCGGNGTFRGFGAMSMLARDYNSCYMCYCPSPEFFT
jgi:hypothetical protein